MSIGFCCLDLTSIKSSSSKEQKLQILFQKSGKPDLTQSVIDVVATSACIYYDTTLKPTETVVRQETLRLDLTDLQLTVFAVCDTDNHCFSVFFPLEFQTEESELFAENVFRLIVFLFGSASVAFRRHCQEASLLLTKAIVLFERISERVPYTTSTQCPTTAKMLIQEFSLRHSTEREERELIIISDLFLMTETEVLYGRKATASMFHLHLLTRPRDKSEEPVVVNFHPVSAAGAKGSNRYSLLLAGQTQSLLLLVDCQLRHLRTPPALLVKQARRLLARLAKLAPLCPVRLEGLTSPDQLLQPSSARRDSKLLSWLRSARLPSSSSNNAAAATDDSKLCIRLPDDPTLFSLSYRSELHNFRLHFPIISSSSPSAPDTALWTVQLRKTQQHMHRYYLSSRREYETITRLVPVSSGNQQDDSSTQYVHIMGICDTTNCDWLVLSLCDKSADLDLHTAIECVRQFCLTNLKDHTE